jgi:Mn2+/Fe2+ NRAMP family transporter
VGEAIASKTMKLARYHPGPGMMVSAAFIGPGTVTACTLAGANFGFALLWALVFATITTIVLQSFAIRIALVTRLGLAEAMLKSVDSPVIRALAALLLMSALVLGNAAYEAGNMSGAALGLEAVYGGFLPFGSPPRDHRHRAVRINHADILETEMGGECPDRTGAADERGLHPDLSAHQT